MVVATSDGTVSQNSVKGQKNAKKGSSNNLLSFPSKEMPHSMLLVFKKYEYKTWNDSQLSLLTSPTSGGRSRAVELMDSVGIQLPFPKQLVDSTNVRNQAFERSAAVEAGAEFLQIDKLFNGDMSSGEIVGGLYNKIGGTLYGAGSAVGGAIGTAMKDPGQAFKAVQGALESTMNIKGAQAATMAAFLLRSKFPNVLGGQAGRSINNILGNIANPREALTFDGVDLRKHRFSWELFPSNQTDSNLIRDIVATFKRNTLPEAENFGSIQRALLSYPSTVDMYLLGINQEHFMKFKTCMIDDISVDYGGGGPVSILQGGKPAAVSISVSFTEMDIETAGDYGGGLEPPTVTGTNTEGATTAQGTATTETTTAAPAGTGPR